MKRRLLLLALAASLLAPACGQRTGGGPAPSPGDSPVRVEVTNDFALPVEIYVVGSGINYRVGMVHPGMSGSFQIPPAMVGNGSVEFQARPANSGNPYRSGQLLLAPGRVVVLRVAAQLFNSTTSIQQ